MSVKLSKRFLHALAELCFDFAMTGQTEKAREILHELLQPSDVYSNYQTWVAMGYMSLNRIDEALDALEMAFQNKEAGILSIKHYPFCQKYLHDQPRYHELIKKIGYTD